MSETEGKSEAPDGGLRCNGWLGDLTDAQCDAFRRLPLNFNDMVRVIFNAGANKHWVRIDEKTPELSGYYYVYPSNFMDERACWWNNREKGFERTDDDVTYKYAVTHWRTMSGPPNDA